MATNTTVSFLVKQREARIILEIARRASAAATAAGFDYPVIDASMDVTACHANGCPLKLITLRDADDFNFAHDVFGIRRHINRETGKLDGMFVPRAHATFTISTVA